MNINFQPYATRLRCICTSPVDTVAGKRLLAALLEEVGRQCQAAGARLIGHIKCLAEFEGGYLHCSLTDFHRPADVDGETTGSISSMEVLLHVLVYGMTGEQVERCVRLALSHVADETKVVWTHIWPLHNHPLQAEGAAE